MPKSIFDIINEASDLKKAFQNTLQPLSPLKNTPSDYAMGDIVSQAPQVEPAPQPAINPVVKEALLKKLNPTASQNEPNMPAYDPQADYESKKVNPWAAFASGIGDAIAGRNPNLQWVDEANKSVYDQTVGKAASDAKAAEAKRQFDAEMAFKNKQLAEESELKKYLMRSQAEQSKPDERKLNSADSKRLSDATMASEAIVDMANALNSGERTFKVKGDNRYTEARNRFIEGLGRMQSGGAISKDEVENFKRLAPSLLDSEEMKQVKLEKMQRILNRVISSYGGEAPQISTPVQKPGWAK